MNVSTSICSHWWTWWPSSSGWSGSPFLSLYLFSILIQAGFFVLTFPFLLFLFGFCSFQISFLFLFFIKGDGLSSHGFLFSFFCSHFNWEKPVEYTVFHYRHFNYLWVEQLTHHKLWKNILYNGWHGNIQQIHCKDDLCLRCVSSCKCLRLL